MTRSSTWRSWVTSTSPPRWAARRSSSQAMASMSRWLVGSSRMSRTSSARPADPRRPGPGPAPPAWPRRPTAWPPARRAGRPCPGGRAPPPPPSRCPTTSATVVPASCGVLVEHHDPGAAAPAHHARLGLVDARPAGAAASTCPQPLSPTTARRSPEPTVTATSANSGRPGRLAPRPAASSRITPGRVGARAARGADRRAGNSAHPGSTVEPCLDRCWEPPSCASRTPNCSRAAAPTSPTSHVDGLLHLRFVRSTVAHARITSIDTSEAAALPGVVAVLTAADLELPAHHGLIVLNPACPARRWPRTRSTSSATPWPWWWPRRRRQAEDAAEAVIVDYEPLDAADRHGGGPRPRRPAAVRRRARQPDRRAALGRRRLDLFAGADVVVRARIENQRIAVMPMEGNSIAVVPGDDGDGHDLTLYVSTQMPHGSWPTWWPSVFELPVESLRVVTPHVGGGFGGKAGLIAEHSVGHRRRPPPRPAGRCGPRPAPRTSWPCPTGGARCSTSRWASPPTAPSSGMRVRSVGDAGAYAGFGGALLLGPSRMMAQGVYRIPKIGFEGAVAATTTTPMGAFRGAGRPEAAAMLERIMDIAADELGIDPVELRLQEPPRRRRVPLHHAHGHHLRQRRLRPAAARGGAAGRLRRAAGRAGGAAASGATASCSASAWPATSR